MALLYILEIGCQLNIVMKNNKGYYHWIHSLNQASKQVQHNHAKLLHEATYNPTVSGETGLKTGRTRIHGSSRPSLNIGGMIPTGGIGFGGEEYEDLGDEPGGPGKPLTHEEMAEIMKMSAEKRRSTPHRTTTSRNAGENVASHEARAEETARSLFDRAANVSPEFRSPIGAQARIEAGHGVRGDVELAARDMEPTQSDLDGNGIVGDAGDVAIDVSDNVRDNRYQFSPPLYSSPEEANAAVRQLNRQMGSTRVAGQPTQTSAPNTNISSVPATTSVSGEKPVLRGREAQIAMAMKKGKRLQTESLSTIISRMLNG